MSLSETVTIEENAFDCEGYFQFIGGDVGVANVKPEKYHFFSPSVTCWPLNNGIFYMVVLVMYLIIPLFLLFFMNEFVNDWF